MQSTWRVTFGSHEDPIQPSKTEYYAFVSDENNEYIDTFYFATPDALLTDLSYLFKMELTGKGL